MALSISTTFLPSGTVGTAYNTAIAVSGGVSPYSFSAAGLPAGLTINGSTGAITGTPVQSAIGTTPVSFIITDSTSPTPLSTTVTLTIIIQPSALTNAITLGYIEQNLLLTLAWSPVEVGGDATYSIYEDWNIWIEPQTTGTPILQSVESHLPTGLEFGGTVSARTFQSQLADQDNYSISMQALSSNPAQYTNAQPWSSYLSFPAIFTSASVIVSEVTAQINQPILISLNDYTGADQWRLVFQDGSSTAWLPLSVINITYAFSAPGAYTFSVEVQKNYTGNNPPVQLRRSISESVFINNTVYVPTQVSEQIITGTVGMYGDAGFEIIDAVQGGVPEPFAVIVRSLVRDTVTNELKLFVALSRYENASSILGTLAADVFPLIGRPQIQDLMEIPDVLTENSASSNSPVSIITTSLPLVNQVGSTPEIDVIVGQSMGEIPFTASGGKAPYSWYAADLPFGLKFTIDGTLSGVPMLLGIYQTTISVVDSSSPGFINTLVINIAVRSNLSISTAGLTITGGNIYLPAAQVMTGYSYQLLNTGGIAPFTWAVAPGSGGGLPGNLTVSPSGLISGTPTTTNSTTDFQQPFFVTIQVSDAIGAQAEQYFGINLSPAALTIDTRMPIIFLDDVERVAMGIFGGKAPYSVTMTGALGIGYDFGVTDGRWEFNLNVGTNNYIGVQSLGFTVTDSASNNLTTTSTYTVAPRVEPVFGNTIVDYLWENGDSSTVSLALSSGLLGGLSLGTYASSITPNGIQTVVTGSELVFSEVSNTNPGSYAPIISIPIAAGPTQVATVSHAITVENSSGVFEGTPVIAGNLTTAAMPYLLGTLVTVNPLKPSYNSPSFSMGTGVTAQLASPLPAGLSLDSSTGLIYGILADTTTLSSSIDYVLDEVITGTVTIAWTNFNSVMTLTDNLGNPRNPYCTIQLPYSGTIQADRALTGVAIVAGRLPSGLSAVVNSVNPTQVVVSGTTLEAGYFDVWFRMLDASGNVGVLYKRFVSSYVTPLAILTSSLPDIIPSVAYSVALQAVGGIGPYTWTLTGGSLPSGITLASTGLISGTTTSLSFTSTLNLTVTDSRGIQVVTNLGITINDTLTITNSSPLPNVTQSASYSVALKAVGGSGTYTSWAITAGSLPSGITLNTSTGVISGTGPGSLSGPQSVTFQVTDSLSTNATKTFTIAVTQNTGIQVNYSGVGVITRSPVGGTGYLGTLTVTQLSNPGVGVPPYTWSSVALPNYLVLNSSTGVISGTTNQGAPGSSSSPNSLGSFAVTVVDSNGLNNTESVPLESVSSVVVTTLSLPNGTLTANYSQQLTATTNNPSIASWAMNSGGLPTGLSLSSSGLVTGIPTATGTFAFTVICTDAIGDTGTSQALSILVQNTTLVIATTSIPNALAGVSYTAFQMQATGGDGSYIWSIDPSSVAQLPPGITMTSSGLIVGNTIALGSSNITFRLTDTTGAYVTGTLTFTVASNLTLQTGVDFIDGTSTGYIGAVAAGNVSSINPRPNNSFYVLAKNIISATTNQITASTSVPGITATVSSITTYNSVRVAWIQLTGSFNGQLGDNPITISIVDSGVPASATFKWSQYVSLPIAIVPSSGAIPTYFVG
jgi:hypothetical protein